MKKLLYILLFVPLAFFGQENYSLSFDGVLNNIVIPEIPSYEENTHSILIWFNNSQVNQGDIISKDDELISKRQWLLGKMASNSIKAHVWTNENLYTITTEPISQNKWYHLAQIWDGSILSLYIDGELIDSIVTDETGLRVSDCPIRIAGGAIEPGPGFYLQSHLEDAQIWNIPLSEQQIQSYMACPPLGIEEGLVGYWNFNEGSGNIVYDISGNGNHGVINGATYSEDVPQENDCIEGCIDSSAVNYNNTAHINDGSCISQEEYTIDSLNSVVEQATNSLSSLQQALDTWNTTIDLSAGWNMFGYGCPSSIDLVQGLSSHTELIAMVKDNNGSAYIPEFDFNGIGDLTPGFGYQIKVTEAIEGFSLCDWYVNDIPEDNIVSLQDSIDMLNSDILDLECINQVACSFNIELNECEFPQEGYDCDGNYILQIGDEAYGGIVFYIDETNQYGLVAAIDDLDGVYQWGCSNYTIPGADGTAIGTGYQNTLDIVSGCNQPATAAKQAVEFESEIYTDWYLPSINELVQIYNTIGPGGSEGNIGDFENTYYWSSSQYNNHDAWILNFYNNYVERDDKPHSFKVRVIRAFGNYTMGCMGETACNYNPEANMADGSCEYANEGYDCNGNTVIVEGCTDLNYLEYDPTANTSDFAACVTLVVGGCMDSLACNFNSQANMEDGSCNYAQEGYDCEGNELFQIYDFIYIGKYNGNDYYLSEGLSYWEEANLICNENGGHLVTISDNDENMFISNALINSQTDNLTFENWELRCEIGLKKIDGQWTWVTGEPVDFTKWSPQTNEPSGDGNCAHTNHDIYHPNYGSNYFGYWNDHSCNSGETRFILEIEN